MAATDHSPAPDQPFVASVERGFLGLGSNVGDRRAQLQWAVDRLPSHGVRVVRSSSTYDTDPVGEVLDQPAFLNVCVEIETARGPFGLLDACKAIEQERGRVLAGEPGYVKDGPRAIDLDVLLLGDHAFAHERLTLPHEQATTRRFVLIPLLELDFELCTPGGVRLADALAQLPLDEGVRREGPPLDVGGSAR
ncbi:MAG: 2-amino-4-hydroxy-6-hydroxymethyldihydropteridine diphosphokinase [Patulibacter sp.]